MEGLAALHALHDRPENFPTQRTYLPPDSSALPNRPTTALSTTIPPANLPPAILRHDPTGPALPETPSTRGTARQPAAYQGGTLNPIPS